MCVYVNAMAHERDVKTSVREMNTQLTHIGVAGPNLEVRTISYSHGTFLKKFIYYFLNFEFFYPFFC